MTRSITSAILGLGFVIAVAVGCNQSKGEPTSAVEGNPSTTADGNSKSSTATPKDLSGTYDITGTNENGAGAYKGTLTVTERGDVLQFSWDTAGKKYDGVGVQNGNNVAAAFASGTNGEGCGVVLYQMSDNATLEGIAGYWGNNKSESETARRVGGMDLDGDYAILGTNTEGNKYSGRLRVKPSGAGYTFSWIAGSSFEGFGIKQGDSIAVGIGGSKCGFVGYEIKPDGTLEGKWGGYGSTSVGTEIARKR